MKFFSAIVIGFFLVSSVQASTDKSIHQKITLSVVKEMRILASLGAHFSLDWRVGDKLQYSINYSADSTTILEGKINYAVTESIAEGFMLEIDQDLGPLGRTQLKGLFDKESGVMKRLWVNGREEQVPDQAENDNGSWRVVEQREDTIVVGGRSIDCVYIEAENDSGARQKIWVNSVVVPLTGLVKSEASQSGTIFIQELLSFERGT